MGLVSRFLIIFEGMLITIVLGRYVGVEYLVEYSYITITSILVAEISRTAVDQSLVRLLREKKISYTQYLQDMVLGLIILMLLLLVYFLLSGELVKALTIFVNAFFVYFVKSSYPFLVVMNFKEWSVVVREGVIVSTRALSILLYFSFGVGTVETLMLFVGSVSSLFAVALFCTLFTKYRKMTSVFRYKTNEFSIITFHFSKIGFYISTSPSSLFNALVVEKLRYTDHLELIGIFHVFSRLYSPVNIVAVMQIARHNLVILQQLNNRETPIPTINIMVLINCIVWVSLSVTLFFWGGELLGIWGLEYVNTEQVLFPLVLMTLGIAISGPWVVILDYFDDMKFVFVSGVVVIVSFISFYFVLETHQMIYMCALMFFLDRITKALIIRKKIEAYL